MIPGGVPTKHSELVGQTRKWIEECNVTVGQRKAYYRLLNAIAETGKYDGTKSLINTLNNHLQRVAAHLFSPVELKFAIDFDRVYNKRIYERANEVAKIATRTWDRNGTDNTFDFLVNDVTTGDIMEIHSSSVIYKTGELVRSKEYVEAELTFDFLPTATDATAGGVSPIIISFGNSVSAAYH